MGWAGASDECAFLDKMQECLERNKKAVQEFEDELQAMELEQSLRPVAEPLYPQEEIDLYKERLRRMRVLVEEFEHQIQEQHQEIQELQFLELDIQQEKLVLRE